MQIQRKERTMQKTNLKFKDFLSLLSPAQQIKVQDEDNPLKQEESTILFKGKVAKARREEALENREVKMITIEKEQENTGSHTLKIWLYR